MRRFYGQLLACLLLIAGWTAPAANATAVAAIDEASGQYVISAHLIFYGAEATDAIARASVDEIMRLWNQPQVDLYHLGKPYRIVFKITYDVYAEDPRNGLYGLINEFSVKNEVGPHGYPYYFSEAYLRDHPELNVVSVQRYAPKNDNRSNYVCGGQSGVFLPSDNLGVSTTVAHEFGHGLGLPHVEGAACKGDRPSIMCMRGSITEPAYQYDPKAKPGSRDGGTINPYYRVVRVTDIEALRLPEIPVEKDGSRIVGPYFRSICATSKI